LPIDEIKLSRRASTRSPLFVCHNQEEQWFH